MIIEVLKVIFLGIVEGITEWLPVSSTAHMLIVDEFIHLDVSTAFKDVFLVVIQLGAILAVFTLFLSKLNPFDKHMSKQKQRDVYDLWIKIIIGCIPAGIIGVLLDDYIDELFYNNYLVYTVTLIFFGIMFIVLENWAKNRKFNVKSLEGLSNKQALGIGLFQTLALIPGTSRSGSTIIGGLLLGIERDVVSEFTFLMAMPIIGGASLLKLLKYGFHFTSVELTYLIIGCLVAFVTSVFVINTLLDYVKRHDFKGFGVYRIILGIVILVYFYLVK